MITLSIILFIFINIFRWAELSDATTVSSFKDYINYNQKIIIRLASVWFAITLIVCVLINS